MTKWIVFWGPSSYKPGMDFRAWWQRHRREWSQRRIAQELSVTAGAVQRWIKAQRTPRDEEIARLTDISQGDVCVLDFFPKSAAALEEADQKREAAKHHGEKHASKQTAPSSSVPIKRDPGKQQNRTSN